MIPKGWVKATFEDVASIANGQVDPKVEPYLNYLHVGPENIVSGSGSLQKVSLAKDLGLISGKYLFDEKAIVYSKIRPNLNKVCIPGFVGICSADMYPIWPRNGLSLTFLFQYMLSDWFVRQATAVSGRTGLPKINREDLNLITLLVPPLAEQRKIAAILGTWDAAIAAARRLVAALRTRKRALMQRLLTGEVRFPDFTSKPWKEQKIGDFLRESRVLGTNGQTAKKLTVKLYGKGVIPKHEPLLGSSATRYYKRRAGQFIYSKLDFLNGAFGIVPEHLDGYESTLDLPALDISSIANGKYLLEYVIREDFYKRQLGLARGGRKARRVPPEDFLRFTAPFPDVEEQNKIAELVQIVDAEIETTAKLLEGYKQQKRGLMQLLLTGEVRVAVDERDA